MVSERFTKGGGGGNATDIAEIFFNAENVLVQTQDLYKEMWI